MSISRIGPSYHIDTCGSPICIEPSKSNGSTKLIFNDCDTVTVTISNALIPELIAALQLRLGDIKCSMAQEE